MSSTARLGILFRKATSSIKIGTVVMGMAHRGRLNVLVNIAGKPARALFNEFDGKAGNPLPEGDVKYQDRHSGDGHGAPRSFERPGEHCRQTGARALQ